MPHEPTDEQVAEFVEQHPGGATLDELASALGVSRQRANQLVNKAVAHFMGELTKRQLQLHDLIG